MRLLTINILLILTTSLWSQTNLGVGLVSINFDDKTTLYFYNDTTDQEPSKIINFFNDQTINSLNIKNIDKIQEWLKPEVLWLDYSSFIFRCLKKEKKWFQVITNNENGDTFWLKKSNQTDFKDWEDFLKNMFGVARLSDSKQMIRISPADNGKIIDYIETDCFQVKSMKGKWIEIFTPNYCTGRKKIISSGWFKWNDGNKLLIEYYITN